MSKMNFIKRAMAVVAIVASSAISIFAAEPTGVVVDLNDGNQVKIFFESNPLISLTTDGVSITSDNLDGALTYEFDKVKKVYFDEFPSEVITGIEKNEAVEQKATFAYSNGVIKVSGLKGGAQVRVVALNGAICKSAKATNDGTLELDINNIQAGVYIVTAGNVNFKITKK